MLLHQNLIKVVHGGYLTFVTQLFSLQKSYCKSSKPRLLAACGLLYPSTTCLLVWLLGHINLAGLRSEAEQEKLSRRGRMEGVGEGADRSGLFLQRNGVVIVQQGTKFWWWYTFCVLNSGQTSKLQWTSNSQIHMEPSGALLHTVNGTVLALKWPLRAN